MCNVTRDSLLRFFVLVGALVVAVCSAMGQPDKGKDSLTTHQKLARDIFRELIEINTTVDSGSTRAAEAMATRLEGAGFADSDISVVGPRPQNMNLVVRYRGKGTLRPILFIGHLDVVTALREDWSFNPFTFLEKDGYFYGRGTTDMKCEDADLVANLIRLKQEGFIPNRDIIVALTEGEEGGDANGIIWLLENRRDLIDADFCINPDGGGGDIDSGRHTVIYVQTSEKTYVSYQLEVKNKGGHSSLPVKDNAIYSLAAGLTRLAAFDFPIRLNETTRMCLERRASRETGQKKSDVLAILKVPMDTAAVNRIASSYPDYNATMRTTCVATMLSGGHAENALPQTARATVNCRLLPEDSSENVMAELKSIVADSQIAVTCLYASASSSLSPLRKDVMETVERITAAMWPGVVVTPMMSAGATDGRSLRRAGIPVYGVSGIFTDANDVRAHGKDERIGVTEFYEGVDFMYRFMKSVSR